MNRPINSSSTPLTCLVWWVRPSSFGVESCVQTRPLSSHLESCGQTLKSLTPNPRPSSAFSSGHPLPRRRPQVRRMTPLRSPTGRSLSLQGSAHALPVRKRMSLPCLLPVHLTSHGGGLARYVLQRLPYMHRILVRSRDSANCFRCSLLSAGTRSTAMPCVNVREVASPQASSPVHPRRQELRQRLSR